MLVLYYCPKKLVQSQNIRNKKNDAIDDSMIVIYYKFWSLYSVTFWVKWMPITNKDVYMTCTIEFEIFNVKQIILLLEDYIYNTTCIIMCNMYYAQISLLRIIYTEFYAKNMHILLSIEYYTYIQ